MKDLTSHAKAAFQHGPQRDFVVRLVTELESLKRKVHCEGRPEPEWREDVRPAAPKRGFDENDVVPLESTPRRGEVKHGEINN